MFLWCGCHCARAEESLSLSGDSFSISEQSYSSIGSVAPPPPPPPTGSCAWCQFGVAAQFYELTWNYTGQESQGVLQRPCCSQYTAIKKMRLARYGSASGNQCGWRSEVKAARRFQNQCLPASLQPDKRRAYLTIGNFIDRWAAGVGILYEEASYGTTVIYLLVDQNGQPIPKTVQPQCVTTLTFRAEYAIFNRPQRWESYSVVQGLPTGSPCNQSLWGGIDSGIPEYCTVQPVPA
jgi:hypothetical protein